jgi:16S rRNA (cytidine1402-2'-O)-methyltransferase
MEQGTLYIIATPIGNLEDISYRAVRILGEVDYIAAEDTRRAQILLNHYHIKKPLTSYFDHNEKTKAPALIALLKTGKNVALISEAGTPTISDPGYRVIAEAIRCEILIVPIPGACAAITALSVSGLPVHRFAFEGFLPPKTGKRKTLLTKLADEERTLIFYESPYRVCSAIKDMIEILGNRKAAFAREITKLHEETLRGNLSEILEILENRRIKGEITLLVEGKSAKSRN